MNRADAQSLRRILVRTVTDDRDRRTPREIPPKVRLELAAGAVVAGEIEEVTGVHHRVKRISDRLETLSSKVGELGERVAHTDGKVESLVVETRSQTAMLRDIVSGQVAAATEVRTKRATTAIEDTADLRKSRRALLIAIVTGLVSGGGLLALLQRAGC